MARLTERLFSPSEKGVSGYLHNENLLIFTHTKHLLNAVSILQKTDIKRPKKKICRIFLESSKAILLQPIK